MWHKKVCQKMCGFFFLFFISEFLTKRNMWQNSKNYLLQNTKTQNITTTKNSNCDHTQKLKLWFISIFYYSEIVTYLKILNCDYTELQNKNSFVSKLKNSNCGQGFKIKLWQNPKKSNRKKKLKKLNYSKIR